jgi:hydrogenase-4 component F
MELLIILAAFIISALVCLVSKYRTAIKITSISASIISFIGAIDIAMRVARNGRYEPFSAFSVDSLGAIVLLIISTIGLAVTIYSVTYIQQEMTKKIIGLTRFRQYFFLLNLFMAAMFLATTSSSPIFTWISIEATTLSTAFLISFYNKPSAMEAAWKYLIISSVGLLLGFFGTLLYFVSIHGGSVELVTWKVLGDHIAQLDPSIAKIAFIFVLIGYGTKAGLAPMHTWLPDAHSKAPAPISALLSGVLLNVVLVVILKFKGITDSVVGADFSQHLLIGFGLISIFFAALIILTQKSYKRLLAYSSIENMGIIALGFGFGGIGILAAVLHMIYHALLKSALFMTAGTIFLKFSTTKLANIRGVITALPVTGTLFIIGFLAITGAPPFGIFLTKIFIISAGLNTFVIAGVIALVLMSILFIGFFKHATSITFGKKPDEVKSGELSIWLIIPPMVLIFLSLVLTYYMPPFVQTLINEAIRIN